MLQVILLKKILKIIYNIIYMQEKLKEIGTEYNCPVAALMNGGNILFGYRHYATDKWNKISVWTLPGGRCDSGENLRETLTREIQEETGITEFEIVDFIGEVPGAKEGDIVPIFLCTTKQDFKLMEPEKFSEWKWVTKDDFISTPKYSGFNLSVRNLIIKYLQSNL